MSDFDFNYDFSAQSALYNVVDHSIFIRDRLANQVNFIFPDKNNNNLKIRNEHRLRNILFKEIQNSYNNRIIKYDLNLRMLDSSIDKKSLQIHQFSISDGDEKVKKASGFYQVFPRVFRCKGCNDYKVLNRENWEKFDPHHCPKCGDEYTQISMLAFCEQCGNIKEVFKSCPKCKNYKNLKLIQPEKESPSTWKFKCDDCGEIFDFFPYPCTHEENFTNRKLCNAPNTPFTLINVRRGGLFKSCVKTTVDVPENPNSNDSEYIDEIIIGDYFGKLDGLGLIKGKEVAHIKRILRVLENYPTPEDREFAIIDGIPEETFKKADRVRDRLLSIRDELNADLSLTEMIDYLILKGNILQSDDRNQVTHLNDNFDKYYNIDLERYSNFMDEYGIEDITYLQSIQLISSSYGYYKGMNKFYEPDFVPHFEPHLDQNDALKVYSYPFETEGIIFDLDKIKLANWVINNYYPNKSEIFSESEAKEFLFELKENSDAYDGLKTLIHTYSHILIKRSSLYTGLNEDSCGELLFPKVGAFMIYSTSNVNIGGFLFVFENSIFEWFKDIKLDIEECMFDPHCMEEGGACFSCLHLPEFVCSHFNKELDRDVFFAGTDRYNQGFW